MAAASVGADVLKVAAAIAIIAAFRARIWAAAAAGLLIWLVTTAWALKCGLGFISTLTLDAAAERRNQGDALKIVSSQAQEFDRASAQIAMDAIVAEATAKVARGRRAEQANLDAERAKAMSEAADRRAILLRDRMRAERAVERADPLISMLVSAGVSEQHASLGVSIMFLALLEITSNLGLLAFAHLYRSSSVPGAENKQGGGPPGSGRPVDQSHPTAVENEVSAEVSGPALNRLILDQIGPAPSPAPRPQPPRPAARQPAKPTVPKPQAAGRERVRLVVDNDLSAGAVTKSISNRSAARQHVDEFVAAMMVKFGGGTTIAKSDLLAEYESWSLDRYGSIILKSDVVLRIMTWSGMPETRDGRGIPVRTLPSIGVVGDASL